MYLTIYRKENEYFYNTVNCCFYEVGYVNNYGRELISIQVLYKGRYYDLKEHEKIFEKYHAEEKKCKKRYKIFKKILYILS